MLQVARPQLRFHSPNPLGLLEEVVAARWVLGLDQQRSQAELDLSEDRKRISRGRKKNFGAKKGGGVWIRVGLRRVFFFFQRLEFGLRVDLEMKI